MAQYYDISLEEMDTFLASLSGNLAQRSKPVPGAEWQYTWPLSPSDTRLLCRVYSGIVDGHSRPPGSDAIRVVLLGAVGSPLDKKPQYKPLAAAKRVHRVVGWKHNLAQRIAHLQGDVTPDCPHCGGLTTERKNKQDGSIFFGCLAYPACRGTVRWQV